MGVTLGRGVIKGGVITATEGKPFDLGPALTDKVDTFIGIAGANLGLTNCWMMPIADTCNPVNGYFPGSYDSSDLSDYLRNLNENKVREGAHVYSIFST